MSITPNRNYYESQIYKALDNNKNIVIPTMSAGYANQIYDEITTKYPQLKLALYTASTGGKEKVKLKNVDALWSEVNVLIYSPTISAGVSFDQVHFDLIFGVICNGSCTERDYHQMLRRVRKIEDKHILILNYSNFQVDPTSKYTTYEETKDYCLKMKDVNLKRSYETSGNITKIKYTMDGFDEIYILRKLRN